MALGSIKLSNNHHSQHHPYLRQPLQENLLSNKSGNPYQQQQQQCKPRAIAPAPTSHNDAAVQKAGSEKFYGGAIGTTLDSNNPAVVRRNARERNRVKQVNNGFTHLRQHLPPAIIADLSNGRRGIGPGAHKKLSKVDTLRMAVEYIRRLKHVIDEVDGKQASGKAPTMTWTNIEMSPTNSPPPTPPKSGSIADRPMFENKMQQHFQTPNYTDIFQLQQQHQFSNFKYEQNELQQQQYFNQHPALISPAGSVSSNQSSTDCNDSDSLSFYSHHSPNALAAHQQFTLPLQMKYEQQYNEEEVPAHSSGDEEDLLDYISLWQDDV